MIMVCSMGLIGVVRIGGWFVVVMCCMGECGFSGLLVKIILEYGMMNCYNVWLWNCVDLCVFVVLCKIC